MKKFGAKRFTALIMALALVTIGGVYATWTFAESSISEANANFSISISGKTGVSSKGSYSISKSNLIYVVDQYSSALTQLVNYDTSTTYSGENYDYVQTGGGISKATDSGYDTYTTKLNYSYKDTDTYYYTVTDTAKYTEGYTSATYLQESTTDREDAKNNKTTTAPSNINNYTAALCTYAGSRLRIVFTPHEDTKGTDVYTSGILTTFNFTWSSSVPTINLDTDGYYDASGTSTDIYNLDTDTYRIYPAGSVANRTWTLYDDTASGGTSHYFYYDITGEELVTFLTINKIILTSSSDYYAFIDEAQSAAFTLNVDEDTATVLTTPTISGAQSSSNVSLTLPDVSSYNDSDGSSTLSYYLISIYDGTGTTLSADTHLVATINAGNSSSSFTLTTDHFKSLASGTYYIRVRAIAKEDEINNVYYENSELSANYVTVIWVEGVGGAAGTLTYSASNGGL